VIFYKKKINLYYFIFLFFSLQSYYFPVIKLAIFPPLGFILLLFLNHKVEKKYILPLFLILLIFFISLLIGFFNNNFYIYLPTLIGTLLGPLFLFLFIKISPDKYYKLYTGLQKVIITHLLFFYIQLTAFYIFGYQIDFLYLVTGENSRNEATGVISDFFRPSGLLNEPATYSLFIFAFSIIYFLLKNKVDFLLVLANLTLLLSFSASGILLFLFFISFIFYKTIIKNIPLLLSTLFLIIIILSQFNFSENIFYKYFQSRFDNGLDTDGSTSQRYTGALDVFYNSKLYNIIFGFGIGHTPQNVDTAVGSGLTAQLISFGYLFNFLLSLIFTYLFISNKVKLQNILIFIILLFTTMTFNNFHYWLFLGLILIISKYKNFNVSEKIIN
jgi:hypothetical protein